MIDLILYDVYFAFVLNHDLNKIFKIDNINLANPENFAKILAQDEDKNRKKMIPLQKNNLSMSNNPFRTEIQKQKAEFTISHKDSIMLMGSCFAESIGGKLAKYKFPTNINPFGILFNPISIAQSLNMLADTFLFTENDLLLFNNEWISLFHHGKFSHPDKEKCLETINKKLVESRTFLQKTDFLILTLGTTITYSYYGNVVANCHKIPQKEFEKQTLTVQEIVLNLTESIEKIKSINENIRLIFTVSPVRYIKNCMVENALSKSRLIVAVHELINCIPNTYYFPAFEIMVDDLRDYRFYCEDMIHPASMAIDYIWEIFSYTFFDRHTAGLNKTIKNVHLATDHRVKKSDSEESKMFKETQIENIEKIQKLYPSISFEKELDYLKN